MGDVLNHLRSFPIPSDTTHENQGIQARDFIASTRDLLVNTFDDDPDRLHGLLDVSPSALSLGYVKS